MKPIHRVEEIIKSNGITCSSFEKKIGVSNGSISIALKRGAKLKDETLNQVLDAYPEIRAEWLLTGKGKQFKTLENQTISKVNESMRFEEIMANEIYGIFKPFLVEIKDIDQKNSFSIEKMNLSLGNISNELKNIQDQLSDIQTKINENPSS